MATKTINISLPQEVIKQIDRKAKEEYRSRSEFIKVAAIQYIKRQDNWAIFQKDMAQRAKKLGLRTEDDVEEMIDSTRK